ncbi:MAG TPA: hypothetical protein VE995_06335, partial [Gaiellaceae bacterium]|nr:hypothetical protein [Gaiellaceae bacterium]
MLIAPIVEQAPEARHRGGTGSRLRVSRNRERVPHRREGPSLLLQQAVGERVPDELGARLQAQLLHDV